MRRLPFVLGLLAAVVAPGRAQEALRNAVRENTAYQGRVTAAQAEPAGWKAGPVHFTPGVSLGVEWTDNVNNSEEKESDVILTPGVHLSGVWAATDRSRLSFGLGAGYTKYLYNPERNRGFVSPDSELAYDLTVKDLVLSLYDNFTYSQDVTSQASVSGTATLPRYDNTVGARATWTPNEAIFNLGYAHQNFVTVGSTNSQLDHSSEQFSLRAGYKFRPATSAGLDVSASLTDYNGGRQRDNTSVTVGPFLEWKIRPWLDLNLRGGYVYYEFDPTNSMDHPDPVTSYYASLTLNHQLTAHVSQNVSATHDFQPSLTQGADYVETTTINYSVHWSLRENTSLSWILTYETGQQPGVGEHGEKEEFNRIGVGLAVQQSFTTKFSGNLRYDFLNRESNLPDRGYDQNKVTLTLNYTF